MDPRLNPHLNSHRPLMQDIRPPKPTNYLNVDIETKDFKPVAPLVQPAPPVNVAPKPQQPEPAPVDHKAMPQAAAPHQIEVKAPAHNWQPEVVESIPVHMAAPAAAPTHPAAPIMQMPGSSPAEAQPEDDLEKILQAVNNRVNAPINSQSKPRRRLNLNLVGKLAGLKNITGNSRLAAALAVVVLMFIALSTVAVMAYRQGTKSSAALTKQPGKVGTSYQASSAIQAAGGTLVKPSDLDDFSQTLEDKLNSLNDSQDFDPSALSSQALGL